MQDPEPRPRPDLDTNGDAEAWGEQFHLLAYVLKMSPMQIAQIDYGLDPDHPDAFAVFSWATQIERRYPILDEWGRAFR
ncbi:hypothetical protein [Aurantimonas sp. Leaf443]|uniref:hypothetical protein n=1 Tax=Aurantimonas sp. Leaf443 TaxID=1736378 RepID=UPI0006F254A3|nr:hypothetical protein [Aurantimonas sp. Leaf443]KQT85568.1 hypothetical protein ASG48_10190 [Aurantimonas sp. Leaf443]